MFWKGPGGSGVTCSAVSWGPGRAEARPVAGSGQVLLPSTGAQRGSLKRVWRPPGGMVQRAWGRSQVQLLRAEFRAQVGGGSPLTGTPCCPGLCRSWPELSPRPRWGHHTGQALGFWRNWHRARPEAWGRPQCCLSPWGGPSLLEQLRAQQAGGWGAVLDPVQSGARRAEKGSPLCHFTCLRGLAQVSTLTRVALLHTQHGLGLPRAPSTSRCIDPQPQAARDP